MPSAAFTNTGFDRDHLTPAADIPESEYTFLTSNAVAQNPTLNRGEQRFSREYFCEFQHGRIQFTSREVVEAGFDMSVKEERIPIDYGT